MKGQLRCGSGCGDLVVISTRGGDGAEVTLAACGACDTRTWTRDGQVVDLSQILLDLARPALALAS